MEKKDQIEIGEELGKLKERITQIQRKQLEIETIANKANIMLEPLKPDFITNLQKHDMNIAALQVKLESLEKVLESLNERTSKMVKKLDYFDYEEVVCIQNEIREKLRKVEKLNSLIDVSRKKTEGIFKRMNESYLEFREFKALQKKQEKIIERYNLKIDKMNESMNDLIKKKEFEKLKNEVEKLKDNLRR